MTADSRPIQALWVSGELPLLQRLAIASFLAHDHEYHLYTYDSALHAPRGAVIRDASEILSPDRVFCDKYGYGAFSDCFRFRLLLLRGGWWVDTDMVCLKRFDFDASYVFSSEDVPGPVGGSVPTSGIIRTPSGAPIIDYADGVCSAKDPGNVEWAELGPALIGKAIPQFSLEAHIMPPEVFCPVPWFRFRDLLDPSVTVEFGAETYAVHLWNAIWGRHGLDTNAAYHPRCAYEGWKRQYLGRA